jgi:hypothetical protein
MNRIGLASFHRTQFTEVLSVRDAFALQQGKAFAF